jgi:lanthionine synthetase-like protein
MLIDQARHVPLRALKWDATDATKAMEEIITDALERFSPERFWPAHPMDDGCADGNSSIYFGAAGVIWGLEYLTRAVAPDAGADFRPVSRWLLKKTWEEMEHFGDYAQTGSLLFGDLGTALLLMRLTPEQVIADHVYARASANLQLPVRELMWGLPGSMLACLSMDQIVRTADKDKKNDENKDQFGDLGRPDPRWRALFEAQAERLLAELQDTAAGPIWVQDLYGRKQIYLGPVHGYAGNMVPLMRGWDWLTESQKARVAAAVPLTLSKNARREDGQATWPPVVTEAPPPWPCQHCHGAAGMVTAFADAPFTSPELETLLLEGGNFIWAAGPLAKGSNLCHGTGGNGYAFLKLYRRTGDPVWLDRARAFAMTAIAHCRETRKEVGRGRYSLWTGDIGLAVYLWDCLRAEGRFPTVDVF